MSRTVFTYNGNEKYGDVINKHERCLVPADALAWVPRILPESHKFSDTYLANSPIHLIIGCFLEMYI